MEIPSREFAEFIVLNASRKCHICLKDFDPMGTVCPFCRAQNPFSKSNENHYAEHYELNNCAKHGRGYHLCIHERADCTLEELKIYCVQCAIEMLDVPKPEASQ